MKLRGRLDSLGDAPPDGFYDLTFVAYEGPDRKAVIHKEVVSGVPVIAGLFTTALALLVGAAYVEVIAEGAASGIESDPGHR